MPQDLRRKIIQRKAKRIIRIPRMLIRCLNSHERRLPDFIGIGTMKGGTGSLHKQLQKHPQIRLAIQKEVHFFDTSHPLGLSWYKSYFPTKYESKGKLTGEITPKYLFDPRTPRRIKEALPHAKFIAVLRNPIHRAFSHYNMSINAKILKGNFEKTLAKEQEISAREPDFYKRKWNEKKYTYLARGKYYEQIQRWLQYFPLEQFLFIKSEDLFRNPKPELRKVFDFLGLDHIYPEKLIHVGKATYQSAIKPGTYQKLEDYYREDNEKLVKLLGENFRWIQ